jgi:hypothetical protein
VARGVSDHVSIAEELGVLLAEIRSSGRILAIAINKPRHHSDRHARERFFV